MRFLSKWIVVALIALNFCNAAKIEFKKVTTKYYDTKTKELVFEIDSAYKIIDSESLKKYYRFYNRKQVLERFSYEKNGVFRFKSFLLRFLKFYRVNDIFFFKKVLFKKENFLIKAKECWLRWGRAEKLQCRHVSFLEKGKIYKIKVRETFLLPQISSHFP